MAENQQKYIDMYGIVKLNGKDHYLDDGDTWKSVDTGETFRGYDFDTEEVYHGKDQASKAPGTVTGYAQTQVVADAMREQGFNQQENVGYGTFGRTLGKVTQEGTGEVMAERLLSEGIVHPNSYTSDVGYEAYTQGMRHRAQSGDERPSYWQGKRKFIEDVQQNFDLFAPKLIAFNEAEYKTEPGVYGGVLNRHYDRDYDNHANNVLSAGVQQGLQSIQQSWYGLKAWTGDVTNDPELYQSGIIDAHKVATKMLDNPEYITSYKQINNASDAIEYVTGQAGVALPYMVGIIASYGAGAVLGGTTAAKLALGALPPSLVYTGEVYANMEGGVDQRNAATALLAGSAMAALDTLGVSLLFKPSHLMTSFGQLQVAKHLAKNNPGTKGGLKFWMEKVKDVFHGTSMQAINKMLDIGKVALGKKGAFKLAQVTALSMGKGMATEGVTEIAQEGLGYSASVFGSEAKWNTEHFKEVLVNAGIGGTVLGGGFGAVSGGFGGYRDYKNTVRRLTKSGLEADINTETYDMAIRAKDQEIEIQQKEVSEATGQEKVEATDLLNNLIKERSELKEGKRALNTRVDLIQQEAHNANMDDKGDHRAGINLEMERTQNVDTRKEKGWVKTLGELPSKILKNGADFIHRTLMKGMRGHSAELTTVERALLAFLNTGEKFAAGLHMIQDRLRTTHKYQTASNQIFADIISVFKEAFPNAFSKNNFTPIMAKMQEFYNAVKAGKDDFALAKAFPDVNIEEAKVITMRIDKFLEGFKIEMAKRLKDAKYDVDSKVKTFKIDPDWFWKQTEINIEEVAKHKQQFITTATRILGSKSKAEAAYEGMFSAVNNFDPTRKRLGIGNASFIPWELKTLHKDVVKDIEKLIADVDMVDFLHQDLMTQSQQKISRIVKYVVNLQFRGENDKTLAALLMRYKTLATKEGVYDPRVIHHVLGVLDSADGNYKPLENQTFANAQDNIVMFNGLNQLESAALPSMVEFVVAFFRTAGTGNVSTLIRKAVREGLIPLLKNNMRETAKYIKKGSGLTIEENHRNVQSWYESGQASHEGGVLAKLDVPPGSRIKAHIMQAFFSVTLLKYVTDFSRMTRWAFAEDAIVNDLQTVAIYWRQNRANTEYASEAYTRLLDLNVDPELFAELYTKAKNHPTIRARINDWFVREQEGETISEKERSEGLATDFQIIRDEFPQLHEMFEIAKTSYVEMGTTRPDTTTKPLWANNARYRLFTQYTSWIMSFQSQVLPKIWKDVKSGNPDVTYHTVMMMAYMLLAAYMLQELKDLWKFGEENPYLSDERKIYRGIIQSGLLGTSHRALEIAFPVYSPNSGGGDYTFGKFKRDVMSRLKSAAGPAFSSGEDVYEAMAATFEGDEDKMAYKWKRLVPIAGGTRGYTGKPPY
jgi:hypothetical protein